jgi:hypothetical protein
MSTESISSVMSGFMASDGKMLYKWKLRDLPVKQVRIDQSS